MSTAYVDEPSAWRSPVSAFLVNFFFIGIMKSGGILLIAYQEIIDIGSTVLVLTPITISAATGILAPVAELGAKYFTSRLIVCCSGVFLCLTYTSASFFLTSQTFYPLIGICAGISFALCYCPAISVNGLCFQKHRATATGIGFAGASVGSIVMPLLLTALLNVLAVRSFLLILGAILLNMCVAGVLLPLRIVDRSSNTFVLNQRICSCCRDNRPKTTAEPSHSSKIRAESGDTFVRALLRASPFIGSMILTNFGYITQFFAMTLFVNELHPSPYFIAGLLTAQGVVDLAMRLLSGVISDKLSSKQKSLLFAISILTQGASALLLTLLPSQAVFWVYSVSFASSGAITMTLWTVVLLSIVGRQKFSFFISISYMIMGLLNLPLGYVVSLVKNISDSFREVLLMCSLLQLFSGVLTVFCFFFWERLLAPEERRDIALRSNEEETENL